MVGIEPSPQLGQAAGGDQPGPAPDEDPTLADEAVHGDLVLDPERGHARGVFDADVSGDTLAWIVGREWEPYAVQRFNELRAELDGYLAEQRRYRQLTPGQVAQIQADVDAEWERLVAHAAAG